MNAHWPTCEDCGRKYDWRQPHDCAEARAKCLNNDHLWIDITAYGDLMQHLICGRPGARCVVHKREPFEVVA